MSVESICLVLGSLLMLNSICSCCDHDNDNNAPCNDTHVVTEMSGSIKKYYQRSIAAQIISTRNGIFNTSSPNKRWRVSLSSACKKHTDFFVMTTMGPGDYMQADRYRYEGTTCFPRRFTTVRNSVLFGIKLENSSSSSSDYTAAYICPASVMEIQARELYKCQSLMKYALGSTEAFNSLVTFLTTVDLTESTKISDNPGVHMCQMFRMAKTVCNLSHFNHANTNSCNH